jgi:hypothetical protein
VTLTETGGYSVTVAEAEIAGVATVVAVTVIVCFVAMDAGAV